MLLALFVPWAANAQSTLPVCNGTTTTSNVPIRSGSGSQSEFIYPASMLSDMEGGTISSVKFFSSSTTTYNYTNNVTVYVEEVASATESSSSWSYNQATATKVYEGTTLSVTNGELVITFSSPYQYNGGNLCFNIWAATSAPSVSYYYQGQSYTCAGWDWSITPPVTKPYSTGTSLPKAEFTYTAVATCCPKPKNLACTGTTGTPATATFTWTNGGEETQWQLEYGTASDFSGASTVTINQSDLVNDAYTLTGLTAEQTYYARIKAYCPSCTPNYSNPSNTCEFKPSAYTIIGTGTSTNGYAPLYGNYNNSYDQMIYTASQLRLQASEITKIAFNSSAANSNARTISIYMGHTTKSSFSSNSDFVSINDLTEVYSGTWNITAGWNEFILTTPFDYDGSSNLVIALYSKGAYKSTTFYYTATSSNQVVYAYHDTNDPNPNTNEGNWSSFNSRGTTTSLPNLKLLAVVSNTPKPRNIQVSDITASQATVSWEAPATGTPTGYEYQIKVSGDEWPTSWINAGNNLSVDPTGLTASTDYVVRVRAIYAEGESGSIETEFRTLDACAFPTNFTATTVPGVGTDANFSWVKGYDETAWNLQLATDADFTMGVVEFTEGFVVEGNNVTFHATTLTPEQTYYARVQADCGGGSTSAWSNVETFTPSNYVDYTYGANASTTNSNIPFYGNYANDERTISQYIIPATELANVAGGTIRSLTYYTNSTPNWGTATVKVYVKEVNRTTFASGSASEVEDWETMTQVYNGSLTVSGGQMTITFDDTYLYGGGNLMIGIKMDQTGTSASVNWTAVQGSSSNYNGIYGNYSSYWEEMSYSRSYNYPKTTINYQPTPYKYPVIDEASCTAGTTTAHIAWTVTGATPTGYQYQYKSASATEWPNVWTSVTTAYADLSDLTPGSFYDFRVKALYDGGNESVVVDYSFVTECTAITAFPWSEKFETYSAGDFSHPCWQNVHISGNGTYIFKVNTSTTGGNTTHQLQLPDQDNGTLTKLRLPEMNLPSNDYQFVIDVYRSTSYTEKTGEGVRVYASTNGEIEGATELAFIPRLYSVASGIIPAEATGNAWYTYELPIGMSGTCYIILRGENQYGTSTYMDNLIVEEIPTCARPSELAYSDVTNHSATIEWTAGDAEQTLWQIAYSKTDFDPNTANFDVTTVTTIDATAHPFTLDKILDAESTYYVYVRANCGTAAEPDFGPWNRKGISFTTQVATPAPSNFVASNPASAKVDLVWNAGGGDFESWELYYVASETAPEAPTASTTATVSNITTLPTTEAPYVLEGLNPVTKYYAWIRAKHVWDNETTYSDWVALTGSYFETLDACPTPTDLVATNLTSVSADLSWVGSDDVDSYTVQYRTAAGMGTTVLSEGFGTSIPTDWENKIGLLSDVMAGTATLSTGSQWSFGTGNGVFDNHARINIYGQDYSERKGWLITKAINVTDGTVLSFDLALTAFSGTNVPAPATNGTDDRFVVLVTTDNEATWESLREWNNSGSAYVYNNIANTATGENVVLDLSNYKGNSVKIAFYGESTTSNADNYLHIDNVMVGTPTPAGNWIDATTNVEEQSFQLTGLTAGIKYDVHVKSNCTSGEYCEPISFTTLAEGNMVFTNATNNGKWGTAGNWAPAQLPVLTDEVILRADATIESGCVAEANKINLNSNTLTIADGGQLITNTAVNATVQKSIAAYTEDGGWYFISSPINSSYYNVTSTGLGLITDNLGSNATPETATYDLYRFVQNPTLDQEGIGKEWQNYRNTSFTYFEKGKGYLYANKNDITLNFTGSIKPVTENGSISLTYAAESTTQDMKFRGWNLVGNPFTFDTYVNMSYYKMNEDGSRVEPVDAYQTTTIAPCTGIMVQATETGQSITFSKDAPSAQNGKGNLNVVLAQANVRNNAVMDKAILSFNEGSQLSKFYFGQSKANIYFPQFNEELAIVQSEGIGELPVNFRANENGSYTLSFTSEEVSFSYLHLVDNMTGNDVDLLQTPSYTFDALTTDYESRFKLVFATGNAADDSFAFYSNGNWIINNDGQATLQVIDVTGRILSSESVNGSVSTTINAAPGVYMLRLVNGDNVKVQKVVVR